MLTIIIIIHHHDDDDGHHDDGDAGEHHVDDDHDDDADCLGCWFSQGTVDLPELHLTPHFSMRCFSQGRGLNFT